MNKTFSFTEFNSQFSTDELCLEEIKKIRFPRGIYCYGCKKITRHYRVSGRTAYTCKFCRTQIFPLAGTLFEKSSTPLRIWFYALFLMTHTRSRISVKELQKELGVTYKTAWRIYSGIKKLMEQNNGDLLYISDQDSKERKWLFFNRVEIRFAQTKENTEKT